MRILFDHQVFSLQNAGGASRYHYELMRYLECVSDVRTELWLGAHGAVLPLERLASRKTRVMSPGRVLPPGIWRYMANEAVGNMVAPFLGRLHIYHPTLYRRMPLVRARRMVVTHHDCAHERFPGLFRDAKRILQAKRKLFAEADAILCVSESSRRDLLRFYTVAPAKTRVIHHGLSLLIRCPAAAVALRAQMRGEYLLFAGSRAAYKNFNRLLGAFRDSGLHESLQLLVAGGGPLVEEETALIQQLKLTERIVVLPSVTDPLLAEAYAGARLLVYPSLCEGFGFPPLEAMAAGCPVVVSDTSCLPEICQDAPFYFHACGSDSPSGGSAPQNSAASISLEAALIAAATNDVERRRRIARGLQVAAGYSWKRCGEQTLALYRECQ